MEPHDPTGCDTLDRRCLPEQETLSFLDQGTLCDCCLRCEAKPQHYSLPAPPKPPYSEVADVHRVE